MDNLGILKFFADYIQSELGIIYVEANYFQLEHRLKDIATQLGFSDIMMLHDAARSGISGEMRSLLLDLATNNETSFFRDQSIFKALSDYIIPDLIKTGRRPFLSIWSAASSSGQEVYSIAMEIDQARQLNFEIPQFKILATDVSDTILKRAQTAAYSQLEVQRGLPAKLMLHYFDKNDEDKWVVKSFIRSGINFKKLNLLHSWGDIGTFDIVFCRNVLIYQSVENKIRIIKEILNRINPGGYLILGAAESLYGLSHDFEQHVSGTAVFYRKKTDC
jgi:chemotaxis protein methyltransferase CheR